MKNMEDEVQPSINEYYDSIITDYESMMAFLKRSDDIQKVQLYQYALRRAKLAELEPSEENQEMISYCWLASMELSETDAVKKYLNQEITQEDIDKYEEEKEIEVQQIVELLEQRKRDRKSIVKQFARMFKR